MKLIFCEFFLFFPLLDSGNIELIVRFALDFEGFATVEDLLVEEGTELEALGRGGGGGGRRGVGGPGGGLGSGGGAGIGSGSA